MGRPQREPTIAIRIRKSAYQMLHRYMQAKGLTSITDAVSALVSEHKSDTADGEVGGALAGCASRDFCGKSAEAVETV